MSRDLKKHAINTGTELLAELASHLAAQDIVMTSHTPEQGSQNPGPNPTVGPAPNQIPTEDTLCPLELSGFYTMESTIWHAARLPERFQLYQLKNSLTRRPPGFGEFHGEKQYFSGTAFYAPGIGSYYTGLMVDNSPYRRREGQDYHLSRPETRHAPSDPFDAAVSKQMLAIMRLSRRASCGVRR